MRRRHDSPEMKPPRPSRRRSRALGTRAASCARPQRPATTEPRSPFHSHSREAAAPARRCGGETESRRFDRHDRPRKPRHASPSTNVRAKRATDTSLLAQAHQGSRSPFGSGWWGCRGGRRRRAEGMRGLRERQRTRPFTPVRKHEPQNHVGREVTPRPEEPREALPGCSLRQRR